MHDHEQLLKEARAARQRYEADWFLNLAFFQGHQWIAWDGKRLFRPNLGNNRVTLTDNRIQPVVRTEVAKLTKSRPAWVATPRVGSERAANDARTSERLLRWSYDKMKVGTYRREVLLWSRICGDGFYKVTWDPELGDQGQDVLMRPGDSGELEPIIQSGEVVRADDFPEIAEIPGVVRQRMGEGDVRIDVRSPFDIYPDPLATSLDDCRYLVDECVRSPEYVKERYGKEVTPDAPAQTGIVESRYSLLNATDGSTGSANIGVRVYELWVKPCGEYPQGRHVVWCDGQVLYEGDNPYGCIPYVKQPGIVVPGRFWSDSVVTQLRPIQARLNKLISQIAENVGKFGNPSLLIDALANVQYSGVPGEVIKFQGTTPNPVPQFLQPPNMPGYVFDLLGQVEQSIREISGQFEVSQGTVPSGVTAASAISLLQEQDATRLGPDVEAMEIALSDVGQRVLKLMAENYTTDRLIVVAGEDGVADVESFRADVTFEVPDVQVQAGSTFPRSVAAKQAAMRDYLNMFLQYGIPIAAHDLAEVMRDLEIGGLEHLVQTFAVDRAAASRENADLYANKELVVRPQVDNHDIHIPTHKAEAKSARFLAQPVEVQQRLLDHIAEHEAMAAPAAAGAMGMNPIAPDAPPPPGTVPTYPSGNPMGSISDVPSV